MIHCNLMQTLFRTCQQLKSPIVCYARITPVPRTQTLHRPSHIVKLEAVGECEQRISTLDPQNPNSRRSRLANFLRPSVVLGERVHAVRPWTPKLLLDRSGSLGRNAACAPYSNRKVCEASVRHCAGCDCARSAGSPDVDDRSRYQTRQRWPRHLSTAPNRLRRAQVFHLQIQNPVDDRGRNADRSDAGERPARHRNGPHARTIEH